MWNLRPQGGLALLLLLHGLCAWSRPTAVGALTPRVAIEGAASDPEGGFAGTFTFVVKRVEAAQGKVFLNSEEDYRDQRCLTVVLPPDLMARFVAECKLEGASALKGRTLVVQGKARRVRISFLSGGRPTDKYYYQTHVRVNDLDQLDLQP